MPDPSAQNKAAARARTAAAALALGEPLDRWSLLIGVATLLLFLWPSLPPRPPVVAGLFTLSLLASIFQLVYALRVAFDARILADWALRWSNPSCCEKSQVDADLDCFDRTLAVLFPFNAKERGEALPVSPRPLEERLQGAVRLLKKQLFCLVIQLLSLALAVMLPQSFT